jgi:hypothetical protein
VITPASTTVALSSSASVSVPGQYVTFTANVTAVAPDGGTPTGTVTFQDGSTVLGTVALQNGTATVTVPLTTLGTHTVTAAYTPTGGNFTAPPQPTSLVQTVQPVALEPGTQAGQSVLFVGGTPYNDLIVITVTPKSSTQDQYVVDIDTLNGLKVSGFDASGVAPGHISKVVGIGNGTNDAITVVSGPGIASWLFGGPGNNALAGGAGANLLIGGPSRSLLIGGGGPSVLTAGSGDSILIAGTTAYDTPTPSNLAAIDQIMAEWTSGDPLSTRVASLSSYLNSQTVHNDKVKDTVVGGSGADWFLTATQDVVLQNKKTDMSTDITTW